MNKLILNHAFFLFCVVVCTLVFVPAAVTQESSQASLHTLVHFWCFTDAMANNTPFEQVDSSFSSVGQAVIDYQSALEGYPFDPAHENWRRASMERRNRPTELNYRESGHQMLEYDESWMRGLQVRQPMAGDAGENAMIFHMSTVGYEHIVFSFAAMDEGAANGLLIDYAVNPGQPSWQSDGLSQKYMELTEAEYQLFEVDFSQVPGAENNPDFKVRIRFEADDPWVDTGDCVTFNNVALDAAPMDVYAHRLQPGDIAIIAMNAVETEQWAWVTFVDIPAGTRINFTDSAFGTEVDGVFYDMFRWSEHLESAGGPLTWMHNVDIEAGTVVKLHIEEKEGPVEWSIGSHTGVQPHLSSSGDQIFVYQGDIVENTQAGFENYVGDYSQANMIYGITWANDGWAEAGPGETSYSYIPDQLAVEDGTAVYVGPENNYYYDGPTRGEREFLLHQIAQPVNWVGDEGYLEGGYLAFVPDSFNVFREDGMPVLMHYWHFNDLPEGVIYSAEADHSALGGANITYVGTGAGYMDDTSGSELNLRLGQVPGKGLRVRNPSDTRQLLFALPTTGYQDVQFRYAVRRTTNGARAQAVEYRTGPFHIWQQIGDVLTVTEDYQLLSFDFADIDAANDNPDFQIRILFGSDNASLIDGNNRFDNITLEGYAKEETNQPPQLIEPIPIHRAIEGRQLEIDLAEHFIDPDGDDLEYFVSTDKAVVLGLEIDGSIVTLSGLYRGQATVTVAVQDGYNLPVEAQFQVLVYPQAHPVSQGDFAFDYWAADTPEDIFPDNMLFLQTDLTDPGIDAELDWAYFIRHDDYHSDDTVGFPYNNSRRTRLNGLDEDGISFINTGRDRDLGGAMLALDTTGITNVNISWTNSTILENFRKYAIRLQYRVGTEGPFTDVVDDTGPVEYMVNSDGHEQDFQVSLPGQALDEPYVQLLWRYYHEDITDGPRAELRLDDIYISGGTNIANLAQLIHWWLAEDCQEPDYCHGADYNQDGRVDLADFAILAEGWLVER